MNLAIAERAAELLKGLGYAVDVLPAVVPPSYRAHLFISIHADGSGDARASGFRVAAPRNDRTGRAANVGWAFYRDWSDWLWKGEVDRLLGALEQRQQELGIPEQNETLTPRAQVAASLGYLTNQRERMNYAEYRKQGLPITSSPIESVIKQINRRLKGTEKFWSDGADPMLHLVADRLSETGATAKFWDRRLHRIIASASGSLSNQQPSYQQAA